MSATEIIGTGPTGSNQINQALGSPRPFGSADAPAPSPAQQLEFEKTQGPPAANRLRNAATLFPSARQRTQGEIINLTIALERLGNPFSVRRIPFAVLRDMLTDPMIGFAYYYCLGINERILTDDLRWVPCGELQVGDRLLAFDENARYKGDGAHHGRRWQWSEVLHSERRMAECVRVHLEDGRSVVCTDNHPWLADGTGGDWVQAKDLLGHDVMSIVDTWEEPTSYQQGWLAGMLDGEGCLTGQGKGGSINVSQKEGLVLDRLSQTLHEQGFDTSVYQNPASGVSVLHVCRRRNMLRALGELRPSRLLEKWLDQDDLSGSSIRGSKQRVKVVKVEPIGQQPIQSIETSSRTYVGEGFAMHNTKIPLMRAEWRINCQDPQIAAAVDEALRPVNPRIQNQLCGKLGYGYQPMCKNFKLGQLQTTYRDQHKADPDQDLPTWPANTPALMWKEPTVLAPEHCMPRWNDKGEFDGFTYSLVPLPNPVQAGITELYGYQTIPGYTIPAEFAVWAVNEQDESFGCQPPQAPVLTVNRGYVPIGDLDPSVDRLASYGGYGDGRSGKIFHGARRRNNGKSGYEFQKAERPYSGDLITFRTTSGKIIQTTPNHKFTVRWNREAENRWAVYLMRRGADWRIGMTRLHRDGGRANSGIGNRLQSEGADAAWVLGVFNSKREALLEEALLSHRFHIPDLTFKVAGPPSETAMSQDDLDRFWSSVNSEDDARELLESLWLDEKFPLYTRSVNRENLTQAGWRNKWTIQACNMTVLHGLLDLPIDGGGMYPEWEPYTFSRSHHEGIVVSLEVLPHHHYISGDIITQNSIYGSPRTKRAYRYWWSYWYRWALADRIFESSADPVKIVYYPTDSTEGIDPNNPNDDGTSPTALSLQNRALEIGQSARQGATLAFPGDVMHDEGSNSSTRMRKWAIEYLENKADFAALDATFTHLDALKFRAMMLPEEAFVQPGQGQRSARNVATQLGELYQQSTVILSDENDDYINKHWIPQFIEANFPDRVGISCTKDSSGFGQQDEDTFRQILQIMGQVKGEVLPIDLRTLLQQNGYPLLSQAQQKANEAQIAKEAAAMQPAMAPPAKVGMQGYNSGVGQTQQGQNFYYAGPQRIDLDALHHSGQGSFVGNLPNIPAYKDPAVKASMIKLRKLMLDRYETHIESFVKHLREKPTLSLAQQATQQQQDGQPQKAKIHPAPAAGIAATLVGTWLTGEAVESTVKTVEDLLYGIALHAGQRTAKSARLDSSVVDPFTLQTWAQRRASFVVSSVDDTLKGELTTFLTDQLQRNPDPEAAASAASSRFETTPLTHADRVVMAEVLPAYNFGQLTALHLAGVSQVQAHDASDGRDELTDAECKRRDGEIMSVPQALIEAEDEHPGGTLYYTALSTDNLCIVPVDELPSSVQDGMRASYDGDREQLLVLSDTSEEERREFSLVVGGVLSLA
jgi:hypothetical protein